jgi:tRNA-2-methylthio-N6-dimethylallyladenosine synthase
MNTDQTLISTGPGAGVHRNRFYLRAYGCQMNLYEAGVVRDILSRHGFSETTEESDADLVLLITCSVREHAEQRAIGRLQNLQGLKRSRPETILAVLGCLAQSRSAELANGLGADLVVGPDEYRRLPELIEAYRASGEHQIATQLGSECYEGILPRSLSPVTGMITVMRGCDNYCAYCIVPYVRGRERSKSRQAVIAEAEELVSSGIKDITLVGQNVLAYRDGDLDFAGLLRLVDQLPGSPRIRFLTSHPKDVTREFASALRELRNFCPHVHLPLQSGSDSILQAMNRKYSRAEYLERIEWLRAALPELSLTTDVLVGFPGETDRDFEQTLATVQQVGFDFAYMFRYSERTGTAAGRLEPKVPDAVAARRLSRLIAVQNGITRERVQVLVGRRFEVLVEDRRGEDALARTRTNKVVVVRTDAPVGALREVQVTVIRGWTPVAVISG